MPSYDRDLAGEIQSLKLQLTAITFALVVMLGFQTIQSIFDRAALINVRTAQEATVQQSLKVRQQLDAVAGGVARLADAGDVNARNIIDDLRRQGITVRNPQAGTQQPQQ